MAVNISPCLVTNTSNDEEWSDSVMPTVELPFSVPVTLPRNLPKRIRSDVNAGLRRCCRGAVLTVRLRVPRLDARAEHRHTQHQCFVVVFPIS